MRAEAKTIIDSGPSDAFCPIAPAPAAPPNAAALKARLTPLRDTTALEGEWRGLWEKTQQRFFLSWPWIKTALDAAALEQFWILRITDPQNTLVGLGLFCALDETRHKVLRMRQLRLNETGQRGGATIDIEYNTLLTEPGFEEAAWAAGVKALSAPDLPWDEIIVANATDTAREAAKNASINLGFTCHHRAEHNSAFCDLTKLNSKAPLDDYLKSLSKNTRSHIRRSIRLYEEQGPITLTRAENLDDALSYFEEMAGAHEEKWRQRGAHGVISDKHLYEFHQDLIARCLPEQTVELLRFSAGEAPFAWLYNFIDGNTVLYYMGGFKPGADNRYKPGLVAHTLAIADHATAGKKAYDFMAGADRYKYSLGDYGPDLTSFAIQRPTPKLALENIARQFKSALAKYTK